VAGDAEAADAAAEAFAEFRRAVVGTPALPDLNPEALLISATRTAAARHAAGNAAGICAELPGLLAARAEKSISGADAARLDAHLESCWACRAPVARFKAAERAYRDPQEPAIDPAIAAQIFVALATAAPSPAVAPPPAEPEASSNGSGPPAPLAAPVDATVRAPSDTLDRPTTEFQTLDVLEPDPVAAQEAVVDEPATPREAGVVGALLGSFGLRQGRADLTLAPRVDEPEPESEIVLEGKPARRPSRKPKSASASASATSGASIRAPLPRARRTPQPASRGLRSGRPARRLPLVLPIVLVIIAILIALFVSGVFGGNDPASSPRVAVPADTPADGTPADVVVVPGATDASGDAVEVAKARERERARAKRRRQAVADQETVKTTPAPAASATTPPAVVTPAPPPPPAAATNDTGTAKKSGSGRKIDTGSGATGAEQIPPPADSSTVPDLAPPPEPATTP